MKIREAYTCPLELTHDMIKGKWKPIILWRLRLGGTSLSKLENDIEGISQKMLLEQIKELIEFGLVDKRAYEATLFAWNTRSPHRAACACWKRSRSCRTWASTS
ncbi:winged helix-turn-helix transcriptional regulator [Eggerthella sinensis]|uniref:winged helix-turn-helix transcriptional regulator n=1 Tax=Eggerthella sinensis TaxID=242230 RepID=UPI0022E290F3|nr:helix-turn-helix domain-containing protein [Eggerthella sinensis]